MSKFIKNILCCLMIALTSLSLFNAEARLPKYMAQKAAELLIEKSELHFENETEENRQRKITAYASQLVDFLYSTEKRQHLANWMKIRVPSNPRATAIDTPFAQNETMFARLFDDISETYADSPEFRQFTNSLFPCWTGTLTCFMLGGRTEASTILRTAASLSLSCRELLSHQNAQKKVLAILFVLELIDEWEDINEICETREAEPAYEAWDSYSCVPVPNTVYFHSSEGRDKGTCLISTIRNLLCIFCRSNATSQTLEFSSNVKPEIQSYFQKELRIQEEAASRQFATVQGITALDKQTAWANRLSLIGALREPDLKGFIDTLVGLIVRFSIDKAIQDELTAYRRSFNRVTKEQLGTLNTVRLSNVIRTVFMQLTGHPIEQISVNLAFVLAREKKTKTWPVILLDITDSIVCKKVTIGLGNVGAGQHVEILNIEKNL